LSCSCNIDIEGWRREVTWPYLTDKVQYHSSSPSGPLTAGNPLTISLPLVPKAASARLSTLAIYVATLLLSALLIFAIQPMFAKMVLPRLGGSPSVWSVAMAVFQTALLIGYVYAHLVTRSFTPRPAAFVHLAFLAIVAMTLRLGLAKEFDTPPDHWVMLWLVALFLPRSARHSLYSPPASHCCRTGSSVPDTHTWPTLTLSTPHPISVLLLGCSPKPRSRLAISALLIMRHVDANNKGVKDARDRCSCRIGYSAAYILEHSRCPRLGFWNGITSFRAQLPLTARLPVFS
jgi:hypothetical protein